MTESNSRLIVALHRLEVHAGPLPADQTEPGITWAVSLRQNEDGVQIWGYLRRHGEEGFGQTQSVAFLNRPEWSSAAPDVRPAIATWVEKYVSETMFDTGRRALQSQAALMDFQFDIDPQAPEAAPTFDEDDASEGALHPA